MVPKQSLSDEMDPKFISLATDLTFHMVSPGMTTRRISNSATGIGHSAHIIPSLHGRSQSHLSVSCTFMRTARRQKDPWQVEVENKIHTLPPACIFICLSSTRLPLYLCVSVAQRKSWRKDFPSSPLIKASLQQLAKAFLCLVVGEPDIRFILPQRVLATSHM